MNKLTINLADFVNAVNAVAPAAAVKATRPILNAIHIKADNTTERIIYEATDSTMVLKHVGKRFCIETPERVNYVELNIDAKQLCDKLKQTVPKNFIPSREVTIEWQDRERLATVRASDYGMFTVDNFVGDYPILQSVYKDDDLKESSGNLILSIGTALLEKLVASAKRSKEDKVTISLPKHEGQYMRAFACKIHSEEYGDVTGVLTPMRIY